MLIVASPKFPILLLQPLPKRRRLLIILQVSICIIFRFAGFFFIILSLLVIAKDSARQKSHYVDPKKALQVLQQTGHYSEGKEDFSEKDSYVEDDLGDDALSHVSESSVEKTPEKVFPNGEGKLEFVIYWMCFNFDFLDISLASLRDSEKSIELPFSLRYSPVPAWIKELSYVLSTDEDTPKPKKSAKKRKMPDSCEKGVGTSGSRKSKRLLEQQLTASKSGEFVNCAFLCLVIEL